MSIRLIEIELLKFLKSDNSEIVCIAGQWGVGKTYAFRKYLQTAKDQGALSPKRYSYVSLFGLNSIDDLKYAVFENTVQSSQIGEEPSLESLQTNTSAAVERLGRKFTWFLQQLPAIRSHVGGLGPSWFLLVRNTIVCFDDIERRGKNLSVRDVLGLASTLAEQRKCKVVLILNDEELGQDKGDFDVYFEKVVDIAFKFAPTAAESVEIAVSRGTDEGRILAESCILLGISNIRIIRKVQRCIEDVRPLLKGLDDLVLKKVVKSLVLQAWCILDPRTAPTYDFLTRNLNFRLVDAKQKEETDPKTAAWNSLLDLFGFQSLDEFDLVLRDGILQGFFDPELIREQAIKLNEKVMTKESEKAFHEAWRLFHDSFSSNEEEVVNCLYDAFKQNAQRISMNELNATVKILKELGQKQKAISVIDLYVASHENEKKAFDLENYFLHSTIDDTDVIKAMSAKFSSFAEILSLSTILHSLGENAWNTETLSLAASFQPGEYYQVFKGISGDQLKTVINTCLQFDIISNASEPMRLISNRAKAALRLIGQESKLNALRVSKYGILIADDSNQLDTHQRQQ